MKIKSNSRFLLFPQANSGFKPWFGCFLLVAIAFSLAMFIHLIEMNNMKEANIALVGGIGLGAIAESFFTLETLFVAGFIAIMLVAFVTVALTVFLSTSVFKLIFILASVTIVGIAATIIMQWLIKNWICRIWGKLSGVIVAAIVIALGIILQNLLVR
jgi:hypothetical protein